MIKFDYYYEPNDYHPIWPTCYRRAHGDHYQQLKPDRRWGGSHLSYFALSRRVPDTVLILDFGSDIFDPSRSKP